MARSDTHAVQLSSTVNLVVFSAKIYASINSGSLAVVAATFVSLLDLLYAFITWITAFSMQVPNPYQYPTGKNRMQPLGIIVFGSVMAALGLQIILESLRSLASNELESSFFREQENWVMEVIMVSVILVKVGLAMYCRSFTNETVKAYAEDHFFDVITNSIGLISALLAIYVKNWIDPVGAIVLVLYTIRSSSLTVLEKMNNLAALSSSEYEIQQKLRNLSENHHNAVRHINNVRAYYTFGSQQYLAEVEIVLPSEMPLKEALEIEKALKLKLERLPEIERAFVHLDYEFTHRPEHAQTQRHLL